MGFAKFMVSIWGRLLRIVAGAGLAYYGFVVLQGTAGIVIGVIGLAPITAGVFDFCIFAPLFGAPFWGKDIRK